MGLTGNALPTLEDFVLKAKDLDETKFTATYPNPFLISESGITGTGSGAWSSPEAPTQTSVRQPPDEGSDKGKATVVIPVLRRDSSRHTSIVTVGRGEECDIRLAHPLVSKRHAYFTQNEKGWCIADADSSNGTYADGNRLEPHRLHLLADSEVLRFGPEIKYRFFTTASFYKYVAYRARIKK
jgi:hypothetical protein